ncbi:nucleoside-diphosphate-sugar epimerase [Colletotrichum truncatum]|uniref:Nucleoside-diphosphate-sugar epimerase n=1 Tax=Colletotrichum truncatum TaxID=5467 RepID=A0ACC3ZC84_COLTU|nr:nucleoside-diphosphate-sugar epimerase [Colletotrichum truncatum]KAF6797666.1 nucleoside-diphosphate-sugar epimerase [Colletotrichum truncatum]
MKVLIVGASGMIGGEALVQCLAHPEISQVVAFVRRDLPADVVNNPKLKCVVIKDFSKWPEDILREHADAVGMIWAMGSYNGNVAADLDYPMAFIESMAPVLKTLPDRSRFRCVHLSGKFVRQDQETKLWFLETPRKLKGVLETKALAFAESHSAIWQTFIVKPGGVVPRNPLSSGFVGIASAMGGAVMGENWSVRNEELGIFMAYLAINGADEEPISENARIVRRGRELLASQRH